MLWQDRAVLPVVQILIRLICDTFRYVWLMFRSTQSVKAENLFRYTSSAESIRGELIPRPEFPSPCCRDSSTGETPWW